jgi:hypothetical protein
VVLRFNLVVLDVYKVQGTIHEKFVTNVIQAKMQHYDFYIVRHAIRATNATTSYRTKHKIVGNDMV